MRAATAASHEPRSGELRATSRDSGESASVSAEFVSRDSCSGECKRECRLQQCNYNHNYISTTTTTYNYNNYNYNYN